jgi:hypothetical protein
MSVRRRIDVLFVVLLLYSSRSPLLPLWPGARFGKSPCCKCVPGCGSVYSIAEDIYSVCLGRAAVLLVESPPDELRFGGLGTGSLLEQNPTMAMVWPT